MKRMKWTVTVAVGIVAMPAAALAQRPGQGLGALAQLDLTDAQRTQVFKNQDELRRKNWDLLGKQQDEQAKLRDAYFAPQRDRLKGWGPWWMGDGPQ